MSAAMVLEPQPLYTPKRGQPFEGDPKPFCTTGTGIHGTHVCLDWMSGMQHIISLSTTEAELVALKEATRRKLIIEPLLEVLVGKEVKYCIRTDSQSAVGAIRNGRSGALKHCKKAYDLSICWMREYTAKFLTHVRGIFLFQYNILNHLSITI